MFFKPKASSALNHVSGVSLFFFLCTKDEALQQTFLTELGHTGMRSAAKQRGKRGMATLLHPPRSDRGKRVLDGEKKKQSLRGRPENTHSYKTIDQLLKVRNLYKLYIKNRGHVGLVKTKR